MNLEQPLMSNLVLASLEIKNFRAFKHLRIEHLGRVNLIVGKNNVGKSSVLEALRLYASQGDAFTIFSLLQDRFEIAKGKSKHFRRNGNETNQTASSLRYLFHGRDNQQPGSAPIQISPIDTKSEMVSINIVWPNALNDNVKNMLLHNPEELINADIDTINNVQDLTPRLHVEIYNTIFYDFPLNQYYTSPLDIKNSLPHLHHIFVTAGGLDMEEIATYWDNVVLSELEVDILNSLKLIAPQIEAVNLVGNEGHNGERIPKGRFTGVEGPIPLRSLGEGMNRMFGIILALVNAKDGMLLIDEVDTGLHYSVLPDLWKVIFEVAHRLNVQVFATSHSWDCIQAFQLAADDNKGEEGIVIRLESRDGEVLTVIFDERKLNIAVREHIEVR